MKILIDTNVLTDCVTSIEPVLRYVSKDRLSGYIEEQKPQKDE